MNDYEAIAQKRAEEDDATVKIIIIIAASIFVIGIGIGIFLGWLISK